MELAGRLEDTWKTPGRRLEDMSTARENPWKTQIFKKNNNIILYSELESCLPGNFARGAHVFQAASTESRCFCQRAELWLQKDWQAKRFFAASGGLFEEGGRKKRRRPL